MRNVDLLVFDLEIGLHQVEGDPNLTFIFFLALSLLTILGLRFAYYAHRNKVGTEIAMQLPIWRYLRYIGTFAVLYGIVGIVEITTNIEVAAKDGLLLAMTLLLAFAVRQIHFTARSADDWTPHDFERIVRAILIGAVFVYVLLVIVAGQSTWSATLQGASALAFAAFGLAYFQDHAKKARLQGTMLDSLLRHLVPVLGFVSMVGIVALAVPLGVSRVVVLHIQVVFLIMTATALMTATIKLRQNLAGL